MDEYAALAQRVVLTMDDVHGCLVLSRDGLVLGAFPEDEEAAVKPAWLKFVHVGDARRSFVEFGDQIWAYIHRGPYAAFVLAGTTARPGVLLDQLEQALLIAEETRAKRDTLKVPDASAAPSGRPRASLHPPADRPQPVDVSATSATREHAAMGAEAPTNTGPWRRPSPSTGSDPGGGQPVTGESSALRRPEAGDPVPGLPSPFGASPFSELAALAEEEQTAAARGAGEAEGPTSVAGDRNDRGEELSGAVAGESGEDPSEIDRVLLAKEFSGLLQLGSDDDEAGS